MAMMIEPFFFEVKVFKWNAKPQVSDFFGGTIRMNLSYLNSTDHDHQRFKWQLPYQPGEHKVVFFPKSSLRFLGCNCTTSQLLCAALRQFSALRRCNDIKSLVISITNYLCSKYRFSQEIMSGQGPSKPDIRIKLRVVFPEEVVLKSHSSSSSSANPLDKLDELIIIPRGDDRLHRHSSTSTSTFGEVVVAKEMEEVDREQEGLKMKILVHGGDSKDDDDDDEMMRSSSCPVCLESLEEYVYAAHTRCSHVFHRECITDWLLTHDSCPLCRSACAVWV